VEIQPEISLLAPLNGTLGSFVAPSTSNNVDLGTATSQWRNVYADSYYQNGNLVDLTNYWQRNSGAVSPVNITDNLLLGSTNPSSAQFSVTGIATSQAVASLSGNLVVMPNASNGFGGNVGIGTTNPLSLLSVGSGSGFQVNSSGAITAATGIVSSGTINFSTLNASSGIYTDSSKNLTSTVPTSGVLGYWTRNGTTLYNSNLGDNVGIGTNSPTAALDVNGMHQALVER
jgi:hypothetical protein